MWWVMFICGALVMRILSKTMQLFSSLYLRTVFQGFFFLNELRELPSVSSSFSCIPRLTLWWWDQGSAGNTPSVAGLFALLVSEDSSLWPMRHPPKGPMLKKFHDGEESKTCKSLYSYGASDTQVGKNATDHQRTWYWWQKKNKINLTRSE